MTTPAPTKRSVGRPRKNAKKQENPDCELATKGYVKCLMRKMTDLKHSHAVCNPDQTENIGWVMAATAAVTPFCWMFSVRAGAPNMETMFATIFWISALICLACSLEHDVRIQKEMTSDHIPDYLKKHEEPPCEPKRGCEGE